MGLFDWATTARENVQNTLGNAAQGAALGVDQLLPNQNAAINLITRSGAPSVGTMRELPPSQTGVYPSIQAAQNAGAIPSPMQPIASTTPAPTSFLNMPLSLLSQMHSMILNAYLNANPNGNQ